MVDLLVNVMSCISVLWVVGVWVVVVIFISCFLIKEIIVRIFCFNLNYLDKINICNIKFLLIIKCF